MDNVESPTYDLYMDNDSESGVKASDDYDDIVDTYDQYIGAQVNIPHGNVYTAGNMQLRKRDVDGNLIGRAHANPILDTRVYEVEFPDGERVEYAANVIAECMYAQCDAEGNQFLMMDGIEYHWRTNDAMSVTEMFVDVNGRLCIKQLTKGWLLSVKWKDGTSSWENLCDVKESYPVQCAEYAVARGIDKEPAFVWWVSYTLKKRDQIIAAAATRYHKRTHKYGFRVPKTVKEAIEIDRENGNMLWQDAIKKEMAAVGVAFRILRDEEKIPPGYQQIKCNMIFDIKMEDFKRNVGIPCRISGLYMSITQRLPTGSLPFFLQLYISAI
jgi:hypothetical protein